MVSIQFPVTSQKLRYELIDNDPWFHAGDVCKILGLTNTSEAILNFEDTNKKKLEIAYATGSNPWFIDEEAFYSIALRCRDALKPDTVAYQFRKWVIDVIKTIRKTGSYGTTEQQQQETEQAFSSLGLLTQKMKECDQALETAHPGTGKIRSILADKQALEKTFSQTQKLENKTIESQKAHSQFKSFFEDCLDFSDPTACLIATDIYRLYLTYSQRTDITEREVGRMLKSALESRCKFKRTTYKKLTGRYCLGVKFKP